MKSHTISPNPPRRAFVKITVLVAVLLCASVVIGSLWVRSSGAGNQGIGSNAIVFPVFQGEFISSVNEVGDIESSSNVEIRCRVKSRGRTGVAILELIPEGTKVAKGDFLCQLDDSLLKEELTERKIQVARDKSEVIKATSLLDAARFKLKEYEEGSFSQDRAALIAAINVAKEREKRAGETARHSALLNGRGYLTLPQLQADVFAFETSKEQLVLAEKDLLVYEKFTKARIEAEFKSAIEQQLAQLEASNFELELSRQREVEYEKQVASCRIVAPQDGTLVYANDSEKRDSVVIEEGALTRDGQPIFYLPDPTKMQVNAKVNDSKINKVKQGQRVEIRVDTAPEIPVAGMVRRVSSFPLPRRYYQAPIEYEVFVDITEENSVIRGGLRGKVEIYVERLENVIQAPVSSLVFNGGKYYVLIKIDSGIETRLVEIGSNNEKFVVITKGLKVGENVLVDADSYRDLVEFPAAS